MIVYATIIILLMENLLENLSILNILYFVFLSPGRNFLNYQLFIWFIELFLIMSHIY